MDKYKRNIPRYNGGMPHFLMRPLYVGEINKLAYYNINMASNDQVNATKTYED
jgi:hypothetical protein